MFLHVCGYTIKRERKIKKMRENFISKYILLKRCMGDRSEQDQNIQGRSISNVSVPFDIDSFCVAFPPSIHTDGLMGVSYNQLTGTRTLQPGLQVGLQDMLVLPESGQLQHYSPTQGHCYFEHLIFQ